ncbi:response regulator [bacterium]|nr:response regulator [bacterium]
MSKRCYRILAVEDEDSIRVPLLAFLADRGYEVAGAENGVEALDLLKSRTFDLVILDLKLPYINGRQLSQTLVEEHIKIPILVITALENHEVIYQEAGRLIKMFDFRSLMGKVEQILQPRMKETN